MKSISLLLMAFMLLLSGCATNFSADSNAVDDCSSIKIIPVFVESPNYPKDALFNDIEGWVQMSFGLDINGEPTNVKVKESSDTIFNKAAITAFEKWKFQPVYLNGNPVNVLNCTYTMLFELED